MENQKKRNNKFCNSELAPIIYSVAYPLAPMMCSVAYPCHYGLTRLTTRNIKHKKAASVATNHDHVHPFTREMAQQDAYPYLHKWFIEANYDIGTTEHEALQACKEYDFWANQWTSKLALTLIDDIQDYDSSAFYRESALLTFFLGINIVRSKNKAVQDVWRKNVEEQVKRALILDEFENAPEPDTFVYRENEVIPTCIQYFPYLSLFQLMKSYPTYLQKTREKTEQYNKYVLDWSSSSENKDEEEAVQKPSHRKSLRKSKQWRRSI